MKNISHFILLAGALFISNFSYSQLSEKSSAFEFPFMFFPVTGMSIDMPNRNLMPNMNNLTSVGGSFAYYPNRYLPIGIELRASTGRYAFGKETRTFTFDETSFTDLEIQFKSKVSKLMTGLKYIDINSTNLVKPYGSIHAGYAFMRSRIYIPDPNDIDDCAPIENRVVHKFNGLVYGAEAGLEVNLIKCFTNQTSESGEGIFFFLSGSILRSFRDVEYINVDYLQDEITGPAPTHHHHNQHSKNSAKTEDYNASFINVSSNEIHYHKIGELYRTPLQFIGVNFGIIWRI
ncbi:MAG: hypothetical protein ACK4K0_09905 [Flavobacteriales bacterium]